MIPIKVGVIGCGYWGPNMIRNLNEVPEADLIMVCDLSKDRLDHIQSRYPGLVTSRNYQDMLNSEIEAVVIATRVSTHYRLTMDCMRAGNNMSWLKNHWLGTVLRD